MFYHNALRFTWNDQLRYSHNLFKHFRFAVVRGISKMLVLTFKMVSKNCFPKRKFRIFLSIIPYLSVGCFVMNCFSFSCWSRLCCGMADILFNFAVAFGSVNHPVFSVIFLLSESRYVPCVVKIQQTLKKINKKWKL